MLEQSKIVVGDVDLAKRLATAVAALNPRLSRRTSMMRSVC
jgi:hypothetical protein